MSDSENIRLAHEAAGLCLAAVVEYANRARRCWDALLLLNDPEYPEWSASELADGVYGLFSRQELDDVSSGLSSLRAQLSGLSATLDTNGGSFRGILAPDKTWPIGVDFELSWHEALAAFAQTVSEAQWDGRFFAKKIEGVEHAMQWDDRARVHLSADEDLRCADLFEHFDHISFRNRLAEEFVAATRLARDRAEQRPDPEWKFEHNSVIYRGGTPLPMQPKQVRILPVFVESPARTCANDMIRERAYPLDRRDVTDKAISSHCSQINSAFLVHRENGWGGFELESVGRSPATRRLKIPDESNVSEKS